MDQRKNGGILDMFLKVELTVCAEGWNARCKRKREVEDDAWASERTVFPLPTIDEDWEFHLDLATREFWGLLQDQFMEW